MLFWMNLGITIRDIGYGIGDFFKSVGRAIVGFFVAVFRLVRNLLYGVLCLLYKIGLLAFLASFFFIYKCYGEFKSGVAFADMVNLPCALFLLFIPIGIAILKEIVRPKN